MITDNIPEINLFPNNGKLIPNNKLVNIIKSIE